MRLPLNRLHRLPRGRSAARAALAVAATAMLGAAGAVPASANPDPTEGFGYNVQSLVRATKPSGPSFGTEEWPTYLGLMVADGIRVARADGVWRVAEPTAPVDGVHRYAWATADELVAGLARAGARMNVVLDGTPKWAGKDPANQWSSPKNENFPDYAAFAAAFAARYGDGGSFWAEHPELPSLPVRHFEIWNEPNTSVHWGDTPDAAAYASMFFQSQAAIKAVDPTARVVVGGIVWNEDVAYLKAFFGALGPTPVDGLGSHPYAPTVFSLAANVVRVRNALDELGRQSVPLEINELGWPAAYDRPPSPAGVQGPVSDAARSATMALAVDALARSTCEVSDLVVYDLVEAEDDPGHVESLMGTYRRDGARTLTSDAFKRSAASYRSELPGSRPPVPLCGARGAKVTRLLGIRLQAAPAAGGCTGARVTYQGQPLEEVQMRVVEPYTGTKFTDADGRATVCPGGTARRPLRLVADIPGVAISNAMVCSPGCRAVGAAAACTAQRVKVPSPGALSAALRRGLAVRIGACEPQVGAAVRLRVSLAVTRAAAAKAGLGSSARLVEVGTGKGRVSPGGSVVLRASFGAKARRALRKASRVALTVRVTAVEGQTRDEASARVTLRR